MRPTACFPKSSTWQPPRGAVLYWPVAMHLAEFAKELEWLRSGTGPFFEFDRVAGLDREHAQTRAADGLPAQPSIELMNPALVIHGNYLNDEEIRFWPITGERCALSTARGRMPASATIDIRWRRCWRQGPAWPGHGQPCFFTQSKHSGGNAISGCGASDCAARRRPPPGHARRGPGPGVPIGPAAWSRARSPILRSSPFPTGTATTPTRCSSIRTCRSHPPVPRRALPVKPNAERRSHSIHLACGRGS